ncbi:MAG: SH3 domain-containing protein, partial [Thermomicrobiales bacterium]
MRSLMLRLLVSLMVLAPALVVAPAPRALAQDGGYLGDAPVFTGDSYVIDASEAVFAADIPSVDTSSRSAVVAYFNAYYRGQSQPAISWTGNHPSCDAGTTSSAYRDDVLLRIMYYRGMSGVPTSIGFSSTANSKNQQAALVMSANGALSHFPPSDWDCWTADAYEAAGSSNIAIGYHGRSAVDAYIKDAGSNNFVAGHRRWLLYPQTQTFGTGDTPFAPATGGNPSFSSSNSIWVFDSNIGGPRPGTRDGFVAWPPTGYVPYQVVFPRWTFSYPGANFSGATVTLTRDGANVPVTIESRTNNGYGENTIVFRPTSMGSGDAWANPGSDSTYRVTISGVGNAASSTFAYDVIVIDPDGPGGGGPSATATRTPTFTRTPTTGAGSWSPGMMVRTSVGVNLRSGAGTNFTSLGIVPGGTRGSITGTPVTSGRYTWYPVAMEGFPAGWIAGDFLRSLDITETPSSVSSATATRTPTRTPTPTHTPTRTPTTSASNPFAPGMMIVTTANVNLRSGAGTNFTSRGIVANGTRGAIATGTPVTSGGYTWYPVAMEGYGQGWIAGSFLRALNITATPASGNATATRTPTRTPTTSIPGAIPVGTDVETSANLRLRSAPSSSATTLLILPNGADGTVTGAPVVAGGYTWYPATFPGYGSGYVAGLYLRVVSAASSTATSSPTAPSGTLPIGSTVEATTPVNVRTEPGTGNTIIGVMLSGRQGTVLAGPVQSGNYQWYRLQVSGLGTGWVAGAFLELLSVSSLPILDDGPGTTDPLPSETPAQIAPEATETLQPAEPSATLEPTLESAVEPTLEPAATEEVVVEPTETMIVEQAPAPAATSTIDAGPQPLQIVRIQRTEGSTSGEVLGDEVASTVW